MNMDGRECWLSFLLWILMFVLFFLFRFVFVFKISTCAVRRHSTVENDFSDIDEEDANRCELWWHWELRYRQFFVLDDVLRSVVFSKNRKKHPMTTDVQGSSLTRDVSFRDFSPVLVRLRKSFYLFLRIEDVFFGVLLVGANAFEEFIIVTIEVGRSELEFGTGGNHIDLIDTS